MSDDPLLNSLLAAVAASPADVPLRLHVAGVLLDCGRPADALEHCTVVLQQRPADPDALALLRRATEALAGGPPTTDPPPPGPAATTTTETTGAAGTTPDAVTPATPAPAEAASAREATPASTPEATPTPDAEPPGEPAAPPSSEPAPPGSREPGFDWSAAESQLSDIAPPPFVTGGNDEPGEPVLDAEPATVTLADVGGLDAVKQRLHAAFLGPMRNPELAKAFGKSLRGGLMLYGPPGCGKTFVARAVAGELGARFYAVSLADVLGHFLGETERNVREIFNIARRNAPCVLFLDEMDAIGHRRSRIGAGWSGLRGVVNQLLTELDSVSDDNRGVFILAATNHPWDVDPALRRPGRLDRTILVLPPDPPARAAILRYHLADRPLAGIDLDTLVRRTEDFSGADLAHLCDSASELALADSVRTGTVRPIGMDDFRDALRQVKPSTGLWLESARNVAMFANSGGEYDDLLAYLKAKKLV